MDLRGTITCPSCTAPLPAVRGIRVGRKIKCPRCGIAFTVRAADADHAEQSGGVNVGRLLIVLAGAFAFLLAGSGLAYYCFTANSPAERSSARNANSPAAQDGFDDPTPGPPPVASAEPTDGLTLAEQRALDNAIAKGVWYLKDHAFTPGVFNDPHAVGVSSLAALTLLECGVPPDDPLVQKTAAFVREHAIHPLAYPVYQRSLAIFFLDRLGARGDEELIQYLALCIIAGQNLQQGAWHYECPTLDRRMVADLLQKLADDSLSLPDWRGIALERRGFNPGGWDHSNTQFAVLALWVAQRHGVPIDRPILRAEQHFRRLQQPDGEPDRSGNNINLGGSWLYDERGNSSRWPSMTCSGLVALAAAHGVSDPAKHQKGRPLDDPAIRRALAMLAREIDRPDERRPHDLYFLWSLERVGVLYNLTKIDGKDWYAWGRKVLLAAQHPDGSWSPGSYFGSNPILDTCFALLFLKQANVAKDLTNKLRLLGLGIMPGPSVQAPPAKKE